MKNQFHRKLFYLTLVLLPVQLGYHLWPSWAMVLGRRVDYLSPTLYLTDLFVVATLVVWGIESWKKQKQFKPHPLLVVGLLVIIANTLFSKNVPESFYQWIKTIEFLLFGYYIVRTKPKSEHVATAFSIAVLYSSLIALVQFILQRSIGGPFWLLGERTFFADTSGIAQTSLCFLGGQSCRLLLRPYATFPHPNVLGGFIAVTLPFLLYTAIDKTHRPSKSMLYVCVSALVVGVSALVVTFGRSAWVAAGIGVLFVLFHRFRVTRIPLYRKYRWMILAGLLSIAGVCIYFLSESLTGTESVVVRNQLNLSAIKMMIDNPVFGVGWGNFLTSLPFYLSIRTIYFLQPVHNIYLLAVSQLGIVGTSFICFTIYIIMKRVNIPFSVAGISLFLVFLLGFTDHYFLTLQQGQLLFATIAGLFLASAQWRKSPPA